MKKFVNRFMIIAVLVLMSSMLSSTVAAQSSTLGVTLTCDQIYIEMSNTSAADARVMVEVTTASGAYILRDQMFTVATVSRGNGVYSFPVQPPNSILYFNVVALNAGSGIIATLSDSRECDGDNFDRLNNAPAPLALFCTATGAVQVVRLDAAGNAVESITVTAGQIANALARAAQTRQNQLAAGTSSGVGLWALTSSELQATIRGTSNYDFIFPVTYCGGIDVSTLQVAPEVTTTTTGVNPFAPITIAPPVGNNVRVGGNCAVASGARFAHVVQPGENLFRIGLRYGVPYPTIAAFNGISATLIFVGQCIQIP